MSIYKSINSILSEPGKQTQIVIGPSKASLTARMTVNDKQKDPIVTSGGFVHALMKIEATTFDPGSTLRKELEAAAETFFEHSTKTPIDDIAKHSLITISMIGPRVKLQANTFLPPHPQDPPGEYEAHHFGNHLEDVLNEFATSPNFKLKERLHPQQ